MDNCQHCSKPNPEGMFNCPSCGKRAHPPKWSTQFVLRDTPMAKAIRTDQIDFGTMSMDKHIERTNKRNEQERAKKMDTMIFGNDKK
jgi:RNA polymerase subunit RPABC4/transcription elongation factor Spt4|tara:strand:+ start:116 stop:376 length:261 start_codon:yes stop_codon:yes gene_type:complete